MKLILCEIVAPHDGDLVIVQYTDSVGGGSTSAKHKVVGERKAVITNDDGHVVGTKDVPGETGAQIAADLASQINTGWLKEGFKASVDAESGALKIYCTDLVPNVKFKSVVEGQGNTQVFVKEL
jgi:hypothetical protein